jgi:hypothetical protein
LLTLLSRISFYQINKLSSLSLKQTAAPILFFSVEFVDSGAVAGGGTTASELKTSPFLKQTSFSIFLFFPHSKYQLKNFSKLTQNYRSDFQNQTKMENEITSGF